MSKQTLRTLNGWHGKTALLSSRDQSCVHPSAKQKTGAERNDACRDLVAHDSCEFFDGTMEIEGVCDIEDLVRLGQAHQACPYYSSKNHAKTADIVFLPYNYILDPTIRKNMELDLRDAIVIIDEAHNIESVARDAASLELSKVSIHKIMGQLDDLGFTDLKHMLYMLYTFNSPTVRPSVDQWPLREKLPRWRFQADELKKVRDAKMAVIGMVEQIIAVFRFVLDYPADYRFVTQSINNQDTVCVMCMNPAVAMSSFIQEIRTLVIASGTLTPLNGLAEELGIEFKHQLELPHVVPKDNVRVSIIPRYANQTMDSTYQNASNPAYLKAAGECVMMLSESVPGGILVFVSSYKTLELLQAAWRPLPWRKRVFYELRGPAFDRELEHYRAAAPTGAVLVAVTRGRVSEGIDFADAQARCVCMLGIPFPSSQDVKVAEKKAYQDKEHRSLKGGEW